MSSSAGRTNIRSVVSPVLSLASPILVSPFFFPEIFPATTLGVTVPLAVLFSIAGVVVGRSAMRRIKETGEPGRGIALAGVIIGWVFIVPLVAALVYFVVMLTAIVFLSPGF